MKGSVEFFLQVIGKIALLNISNNYNYAAGLATVIACITDSNDHWHCIL